MAAKRGMISLARRIASALGWVVLHVGPAGSGRALGPLSFWFFWQKITDHYFHLSSIRRGGLLKCTLRAYHGSPVTLADGVGVRPGDIIVELHLDNRMLATVLGNRPASLGTQVKLVQDTLRADLAEMTASDLFEHVVALHGVTILARGTRRLGFEMRPLPTNWRNDLTRFFMLGLLTIYNPAGRRRLVLAERDSYPAEIWLSRSSLLRLYGSTARR